MKFRTKLTLGIAALLFGTAGAFLVLSLSLTNTLATEKLEEKALSLAQNLAANSGKDVYNDDLYKQLTPLLNALLTTSDVVSASVRDATGRTLASAGADIPGAIRAGWSGSGRKRTFAATAQVHPPVPGLTPKGKAIGSVWTVLSFESLGSRIRLLLLQSLAFAALIIVAGLVFAVSLSNHLTRPMWRILEADKAVLRGDIENSNIPEADIPADDLGRIMRSRAAMLSALRRAEAEQKSLVEQESNRVAELEKAYLELQGLREQLTQAEKLSVLGQVLAGVAHEINNPLTGIMGFSELLLKDNFIKEYPQIREDLASILHEAIRCQKVVKGLTIFSRAHKPEKTYISVNELIEQSIKLEASLLRTRNISLFLELDPGLPGTMADYHQLQQVFMNLFINAQQAMTEYKGSGRLTVRTRFEGRRIRAEVEDDGPGIPPENLPRLFEPFFTTKAPGKGTGLGLSLSYGIVSEHGGSIRVESSPGKGALFVVEIPVVEEIRTPSSEDQGFVPVPAGMRVLVVDDEVLIRNVFVRMLRSMDCVPDTAVNGAEGIAKLKENVYDAVFCDMRMPEMGGRELYQWVCANKPEFVSKWVFMTGSAGSESLDFPVESERPCLNKPFSLEAVYQSLQELQRNRRAAGPSG
ncbi:MAG TPA: hypothetical protein DCZ92_03580 [Elusimicrobia bacterium]|nr:hypothetical protein [Elusimicrobiota bacterium]